MPNEQSNPMPCPICGRQNVQIIEGMGEVWCVCNYPACRTSGPMRNNREGAVEAWNQRATAKRETLKCGECACFAGHGIDTCSAIGKINNGAYFVSHNDDCHITRWVAERDKLNAETRKDGEGNGL